MRTSFFAFLHGCGDAYPHIPAPTKQTAHAFGGVGCLCGRRLPPPEMPALWGYGCNPLHLASKVVGQTVPSGLPKRLRRSGGLVLLRLAERGQPTAPMRPPQRDRRHFKSAINQRGCIYCILADLLFTAAFANTKGRPFLPPSRQAVPAPYLRCAGRCLPPLSPPPFRRRASVHPQGRGQ